MKNIQSFILTFAFFFASTINYAQVFCKTIGGNSYDHTGLIIHTTDGNYLMAGVTKSFGEGGEDLYIVKLNVNGDILWTRTIGGANNDFSSAVIQTTDGGFAVLGTTDSFGAGEFDIYMVKLDAAGIVSWTKTFGGTGSEFGGGGIIQTSDGGYTVSGRTNSYGAGNEDLYLLKLDVAGNVSWSTTVGSVGPEYAGAMVQTPDGDYLLSGTTQTSSLSYTNIYIAKINSAGTLLWTKEIGGPLSEWVSGMINSTDGGYILTGVTYSYGEGNEDVYLVKLDSAANLMWTRTVGGPFNDTAEDIIQTADGGYITVGSTISFGEGAFDMYVVKFNAAGAVSWTKTIGNDIYNSASSVIQTADGYIICGITETDITGDDIYLVKLDDLGNTCSTCLQSTGGLSGSGGTMIASTGTTGTGVISGTGGNSGSGGTVTSACQTLETAEINAGFEFTAYPNPTSGKLILSGNKNKAEVKVYTITGEQILNQKISAGTTTLDLSTQPNGVYFILIASDDKTHFQKIILQK